MEKHCFLKNVIYVMARDLRSSEKLIFRDRKSHVITNTYQNYENEGLERCLFFSVQPPVSNERAAANLVLPVIKSFR